MELASEGFMWFQNLLIADSTMILPIMFVLANLTVIEVRPKLEKKSSFVVVLSVLSP